MSHVINTIVESEPLPDQIHLPVSREPQHGISASSNT